MLRKKNAYLIFLLLALISLNLTAQGLGDVNNDNSITIVDALLTAQYYVGLDPSDFNAANADINSDGQINIVDALLMAQIYVGLIDPPISNCDPTNITPYIQVDGGTWDQVTGVNVNTGASILFGPHPTTGGAWQWSGPNGYSANIREASINNIQSNQSGNYTATYTNDCGAQSSVTFTITVSSATPPPTQTYSNEVYSSGGTYYWRINGSTAGSSSSLSTAINNCLGSGREVHVTTGGTLNATLTVPGTNVRLYCHGNTLTCNFTGSGIINNGNDGFEIHDLILRNVVGGYGIRSSAASNLSFTNVSTIDIDWIGIRIDSRTSNPWDYTIYNLYMRDIHVENCGSHGLETYSIDGFTIEGTVTARNCGDCGVLFNQSYNGTVETVDAYNCCWGGGYAGLRYANACNNITTDVLYADRCGRGFFIVQSGPTVSCHLNYAEIRECSDVGIWIENGTNCSVQSGCCESGVSVSGSGSYANVSSSCSG